MMNIAKKLKAGLPKEIIRLVRLIDRIAHQNACNAFLVGGFVRDVLLGVKNFSASPASGGQGGDFDIVVEGDAARVVKPLVNNAGGTYILHGRFGTATAVLPWHVNPAPARRGWVKLKQGGIDELKIDFATARKERYEKPAALPTVEFSTVREDLYRRDFTINAMAVAIARKNFGQLIDFFGGQKDLLSKKIRVLHDASFIDDPTRILRAVRFEQRFNFRIEPHTENLIKEAVKRRMLHATEKQRLRDELILVLKEAEPKKMLKRMETLGGLKFIHPGLRFTKKTQTFFDSIKETASWFKLAYLRKRALDVWLMYLIALLDGLNVKEVEEVLSQFVFRKGEQARLFSYKKDGPKISRFLNKKGRISPSRIYKYLEPLPYEPMLSIMAKSPSRLVKKRISDFLTRYNGVTLKIKGRDLEALGLSAGPLFKKILAAALDAKLDKGFRNKAQEIEFVKKIVKKDD